MGELYVFDRDGNRLHPPASGERQQGSDGDDSDDLTGMPTSDDEASWFPDDETSLFPDDESESDGSDAPGDRTAWDGSSGSTDPASERDVSAETPDEPLLPGNLTLQFGANDIGAMLECVVNGVETNSARERAIFRYETESTTGVFPEFVDAVETELVDRRGWRIGTVENPRNPGYVFQRLRDAAAGTDATPQQLPPDPDLVQALLEAGETVTMRVRDFSVAGDLILRYGNADCNISIAENFALGEQPTGLVVVQDDSIDDAITVADDSRARLDEEKRKRALAAIDSGVDGLADLEVDPAEAAAVLGDRVGRRYDDVEVIGPERRREVSELAERVTSLEQRIEELQERNRQLREKNERLRAGGATVGADGQARSTDGGVPTTDATGVPGTGSTAVDSGGTADDEHHDADAEKWRRIALVLAAVLAVVLLLVMTL